MSPRCSAKIFLAPALEVAPPPYNPVIWAVRPSSRGRVSARRTLFFWTASWRLRRGWLELTIGLAALALILGGGAGIAFHRQAQQYAGLNIAPADLDFGNAWEQRAFPLTVTLHNGSNRPIAVADLQTSCSCTAVEPRECVVPAGGSLPLHLTLDLTTAFDQRPAEQATFTVRLAACTGPTVPAGLPAWELHGLVARPIVFRPGTLEIETVRGQPPAFVAVRVEPRLPLAGVSITAPAALANGHAGGRPMPPACIRLSVTPAAQASVGVTHGEIRFAWPASAASGTAPPSALLPVQKSPRSARLGHSPPRCGSARCGKINRANRRCC